MSYVCPNPTCSCDEIIALHMVTVAREGRPWWLRKVGVHCRCARCYTVFTISRTKGVYALAQQAPLNTNPFGLPAMTERDRAEAAKELRGLMSDARYPSEPGV